MKTVILSGLLAFSLAGKTWAQKFYISPSLTYQFKLGGFPFGESTNNNGTTTNISRLFNIASGPGGGITFGYQLKKELSIETRLFYHTGKQSFQDYYSSFGYVSTYKSTFQGMFLRFAPTIRIDIGEKELSYYISTGLCINLFSKIIEENYNTDPMEIEEEDFEYTGNFAYGGIGIIGMNYKLKEKISLFGEFNFTAQTWAPKGYSKIKHTINGVDKLPSESIYEKESEFVDEYTYSGSPDTGKPRQELKLHFPLSTWGFNLGVKIGF